MTTSSSSLNGNKNIKTRLSDTDNEEFMIEPMVRTIANKKFRSDKEHETFLQNFPVKQNFSNGISVTDDITWNSMKEKHNWGYLKGSFINSMVSWIYIRPDVFAKLNTDIVGGPSGLLARGILNTHYFSVKVKAVKYFKCNSMPDSFSSCEQKSGEVSESTSSGGKSSTEGSLPLTGSRLMIPFTEQPQSYVKSNEVNGKRRRTKL